jgi:hypothetical protein
MSALLQEVAAAVEELFDGVAVRWPDAPDIGAELQAVWDAYPLLTAATVMRAVLKLAAEAHTLSDLTAGMYRVGICDYGQRGQGQVCKALLDLADRIEDWRDRG